MRKTGIELGKKRPIVAARSVLGRRCRSNPSRRSRSALLSSCSSLYADRAFTLLALDSAGQGGQKEAQQT